MTSADVQTLLAVKVQARRVELNLSQAELAARSGVSLGSVRRFETTGEISVRSFLRLARILGELQTPATLFEPRTEFSLFAKPRKKRVRSRKSGPPYASKRLS